MGPQRYIGDRRGRRYEEPYKGSGFGMDIEVITFTISDKVWDKDRLVWAPVKQPVPDNFKA